MICLGKGYPAPFAMLNLVLLVKIFVEIFSADCRASQRGSAILECIMSKLSIIQLGYNRTLARDVPINRYY